MGETVYSFGHMLYEMCAGYPLKKALIEDKYCPRGFQPDAGKLVVHIKYFYFLSSLSLLSLSSLSLSLLSTWVQSTIAKGYAMYFLCV